MGGQAGQLQELMAFFSVEGSAKVGTPGVLPAGRAGGTVKKAARPAAAPAPKPAAHAKAAITADEQDFERF
jgi:hypothetical protein